MNRRAQTCALLAAAAVAGVLAVPRASASSPRLKHGIWLSRAEVMRLPEQGPAWGQLRRLAYEPTGSPDLSDQDSEADVHALAAALVYARTGDARLRRKVADVLMSAIGTERGGRTLALARGLVSYVVAADLINFARYDPARERIFHAWLARVRSERLQPDNYPTLVATHEVRPNNWGTHAGASRIAADVYLGDQRDLARAAAVFDGWLGDREMYDGFSYGEDLSWQANPAAPVGVNPPGAVKDGQSIDGALPDDMRRGCSLRFPPCPTRYPWEAMQGVVVQAELLSRQGYDAWNWGNQAVRRAAAFLFDLHDRYGAEEWGAPAGDGWIPWLLNARYGTHFPAPLPAQPGKGMGFTDWTASAGCPSGDCTRPRGRIRQVSPVAAIPLSSPDGGKERGGDGLPVRVVATAVLVAILLVGVLLLARRHRVHGRTH